MCRPTRKSRWSAVWWLLRPVSCQCRCRIFRVWPVLPTNVALQHCASFDCGQEPAETTNDQNSDFRHWSSGGNHAGPEVSGSYQLPGQCPPRHANHRRPQNSQVLRSTTNEGAGDANSATTEGRTRVGTDNTLNCRRNRFVHLLIIRARRIDPWGHSR